LYRCVTAVLPARKLEEMTEMARLKDERATAKSATCTHRTTRCSLDNALETVELGGGIEDGVMVKNVLGMIITDLAEEAAARR
jgi:hypothetical protein